MVVCVVLIALNGFDAGILRQAVDIAGCGIIIAGEIPHLLNRIGRPATLARSGQGRAIGT